MNTSQNPSEASSTLEQVSSAKDFIQSAHRFLESRVDDTGRIYDELIIASGKLTTLLLQDFIVEDLVVSASEVRYLNPVTPENWTKVELQLMANALRVQDSSLTVGVYVDVVRAAVLEAEAFIIAVESDIHA